MESPAPKSVVVKRFVEEAVVAKKLVVVADDPVAFTKVKFWRVVLAVASRLTTERLVVLAVMALRVEAYNVVVVAFVEVELRKVMFWKVDEAVARRLVKVAVDAKRLVEEAVVAKKEVVVA